MATTELKKLQLTAFLTWRANTSYLANQPSEPIAMYYSRLGCLCSAQIPSSSMVGDLEHGRWTRVQGERVFLLTSGRCISRSSQCWLFFIQTNVLTQKDSHVGNVGFVEKKVDLDLRSPPEENSDFQRNNWKPFRVARICLCFSVQWRPKLTATSASFLEEPTYLWMWLKWCKNWNSPVRSCSHLICV